MTSSAGLSSSAFMSETSASIGALLVTSLSASEALNLPWILASVVAASTTSLDTNYTHVSTRIQPCQRPEAGRTSAVIGTLRAFRSRSPKWTALRSRR